MKKDGFTKRYFIKISSSVIVAVLNTVIQLLLPRAFTVEEFGFYSYNLNVFTSVVVMSNLSMSAALVSKYAKRNNEIGIVYFYLKFFAGIAILLNFGITLLFSFDFMRDSFGGQTLLVVLLGLETAILNKLLADIVSIYDASAISRFPAIIQIGLKLLVSFFVIIFYFLGHLQLHVFYIGHSVITVIAVFILFAAFFKDIDSKADQVNCGTKTYFKEFWDYCKPLILSTIVTQLLTIAMNYTLLQYSGANGQAKFGAAWQLNTLLCYVFTPYAELLRREFAVVTEKSDLLKKRFHSSLQLMTWFTAYFAVFILVFAEYLLPILYGEKYNDAIFVTQLIMIYTIYQAWGQITGSFMLATEQTKMYAVISVVSQILTFGLIFLFQIPNIWFPQGLGAEGIALNYTVTNLISVVIIVCYISRSLHLSVIKENSILITSSFFLYLIGLISKKIVSGIILNNTMIENISRVLFGGMMYTVGVIAVLLYKPALIGTSKKNICLMVDVMYKRIKNK